MHRGQAIEDTARRTRPFASERPLEKNLTYSTFDLGRPVFELWESKLLLFTYCLCYFVLEA